ncbi:MAG: membrane protein insertase YidC [Acidimicrobiales bacterium]|jgi:YidC/Oxa1 family membrane protein insertase|nr:membrane protein insertase YidC [Acidimicrobiales bacterium]
MQVFFEAFGTALAFFYDLVPNYAFAIVMLTLCVMIVVTPLTLKGTRSMMMMQQLQPEMKKIQTRYKDDRQKLNEELLKFYKENSINPLGGCLPLLVQMPVFLVLYQVLSGLTRRVSDVGYDVGWSVNQFVAGIPITKPPSIDRAFDPAFIEPSTSLYQSLAGATTMPALGLDLSESASQALQIGLLHAIPYLALILIVGATGFIQQRQIQGRNTGASINPQQQMIMKIMPIFLPVISFGLPSGLVIYFAVSNLYRIGQQAFITRSIYGGKGAVRPEGSEPLEVTPQPTFREMFGLAKKNAANAAENKAKKKVPAKSGATARATVKTSAKATPKSTAKATPKAASSTTAKPAKSTAKGSDASSGRRTTPKKPSSGNGGATPPTLQPRARKNKKG